MQIHTRQGINERAILVGMITNEHVLGKIAAKWNPREKNFQSEWSNLVGGWCCDYYRKYSQAPGRTIQTIYESWATRKERDESTLKLLERFLGSLSDDYASTEINELYLIDIAGRHFNDVSLSVLADNIRNDLDAGETTAALGRVTGYSPIDISADQGIDIMRDAASISAAFGASAQSIVTYPGDLEQFFGSSLERDGFIVYQAKEKSGKTFMLLDVAWRAMVQHLRVAFFEIGDMSQHQIMKRFMARAAKHPVRAQTVRIPRDITARPDALPLVTFTEKVYSAGLSAQDATEACSKVVQSTRTDQCLLRLITRPANSVSVVDIESQLQTWAREEWVPDVVVIDYADLLAAPPDAARFDTRDQINASWIQLRAISQKWHVLLMTATQASAESYRAHTLSRRHFSNDKRKLAHVTGMIGINQTPEEVDAGLARLNWIIRREEACNENHCIHVAPCFPLSNPLMISKYLTKE